MADLARVASFSTETRFGSVGKVASSLESKPLNMHVVSLSCINYFIVKKSRLFITSSSESCMVKKFFKVQIRLFNYLSSEYLTAVLFLANMMTGLASSVSGKEVPGVLLSTNLPSCESSKRTNM